ncbi:MAG TPA: ribosome maturation factor RimP [Clostridiales bacterium]|nr:ribosome maturation factor RimP [Clostridiales bacterium]
MKLKKFGSTEQLVYEIAKPIAEEIGVQIWDVCFEKEGAMWYLRVLIEKDDGISIDDCEAMTRPLDKQLDEKDPITQSYMLEVGSAGLGRKLLKEEHFEAFIGSEVQVRLIRDIDEGKELVCELKAFSKKSITVLTEEKEVEIQFEDIAFVRLFEDYE